MESWQQGSLIDLTITGLTDQGAGVGRWQDRVVFVPQTVTGDRVQVRLVRVKSNYAQGQVKTILEPSPHRVRPACIVADKCGGCQWQHIDYEHQHQAKWTLVKEALERQGHFTDPPLNPLLPTAQPLHYRNKSTYPLGRSTTGQVQAGYYRPNSHILVNLNQCPIQDDRLDPLLTEIKQDIQAQGWSIYQEATHRGSLRHLSLRIGQHTGQQLLTLVSRDDHLSNLEEQAQHWLDRYPNLMGICLNHNPDRTNAIFGPTTRTIRGQDHIEETWLGLRLRLQGDTFFQVNTIQAEALVTHLFDRLSIHTDEFWVDAYCGIGTLTLPLGQRCQRVLGLESHLPSVAQAQENAHLNGLDHVEFRPGSVETLLPQLEEIPHGILLDPPRKGCDPSVLERLCQIKPRQIVYMSCNPSTLARDLHHLCHQGPYHLEHIQPADFFPQTVHVECLAFLSLNP